MLRRKTNLAARQIDRILHRNRSILFEVMGSNLKQKKISRKILDKKKFNYKYFTHQHTNSRGKTIKYLYDYGWVEFTDQEVLIVGSKY